MGELFFDFSRVWVISNTSECDNTQHDWNHNFLYLKSLVFGRVKNIYGGIPGRWDILKEPTLHLQYVQKSVFEYLNLQIKNLSNF